MSSSPDKYALNANKELNGKSGKKLNKKEKEKDKEAKQKAKVVQEESRDIRNYFNSAEGYTLFPPLDKTQQNSQFQSSVGQRTIESPTIQRELTLLRQPSPVQQLLKQQQRLYKPSLGVGSDPKLNSSMKGDSVSVSVKEQSKVCFEPIVFDDLSDGANHAKTTQQYSEGEAQLNQLSQCANAEMIEIQDQNRWEVEKTSQSVNEDEDEGAQNNQVDSINREPESEDQREIDSISGENPKAEEDEKQPKVMTIELVLQMFKDIKTDLNNFKRDTEVEKIRGVAHQQTKNAESIASLKEELDDYKMKNKAMTCAITQMSGNMEKLQERVEKLEKFSMRCDIMLTGFYGSEDNGICKHQLEDFFEKQLKAEVTIANFYRMGEKEPRPISISFQNEMEKSLVMRRSKLLKDLVNRDGKGLYINDKIPPELAEKRRREKQILRENGQKEDTAQRIEMSFFRGNLKIANETYKKKVEVPKVQEILKLSKEDLKRILHMKMRSGNEIKDQDSSFRAFTKPVQSHAEIRDLYMHMKLRYPEMTHIICSYVIPGVQTHYTRDFCDDGENGAGQTLLNAMVHSGISSRVIFVMRKAGKQKLGGRRFLNILLAAKNTLEAAPENNFSKKKEALTWEEKKQIQPKPKRVSKTENLRGRGGISGKGGQRGGRSTSKVFNPRSPRNDTSRKEAHKENPWENLDYSFTFADPFAANEDRGWGSMQIGQAERASEERNQGVD